MNEKQSINGFDDDEKTTKSNFILFHFNFII